MNKKYDNLYLGLVSGLLLPLFSLLIVYLYRFDNYTLSEFFYFLKTMHVFSKLASLCVIPNLLLFFFFIWTNNERSARGVLAATFIMAIVILIFKFLI